MEHLKYIKEYSHSVREISSHKHMSTLQLYIAVEFLWLVNTKVSSFPHTAQSR